MSSEELSDSQLLYNDSLKRAGIACTDSCQPVTHQAKENRPDEEETEDEREQAGGDEHSCGQSAGGARENTALCDSPRSNIPCHGDEDADSAPSPILLPQKEAKQAASAWKQPAQDTEMNNAALQEGDAEAELTADAGKNLEVVKQGEETRPEKGDLKEVETQQQMGRRSSRQHKEPEKFRPTQSDSRFEPAAGTEQGAAKRGNKHATARGSAAAKNAKQVAQIQQTASNSSGGPLPPGAYLPRKSEIGSFIEVLVENGRCRSHSWERAILLAHVRHHTWKIRFFPRKGPADHKIFTIDTTETDVRPLTSEEVPPLSQKASKRQNAPLAHANKVRGPNAPVANVNRGTNVPVANANGAALQSGA